MKVLEEIFWHLVCLGFFIWLVYIGFRDTSQFVWWLGAVIGVTFIYSIIYDIEW